VQTVISVKCKTNKVRLIEKRPDFEGLPIYRYNVSCGKQRKTVELQHYPKRRGSSGGDQARFFVNEENGGFLAKTRTKRGALDFLKTELKV
jgi:hypothetical protein